MNIDTKTLIIGAGPAGLACAARLSKANEDYIILERSSTIGSSWRNHYDRLHLHTNKNSSHLPFKKFGKEIPKYPSRKQVIQYFEDYAKTYNINPLFNTEVKKVTKSKNIWKIETNNKQYTAKHLIVCSGNAAVPRKLEKEGLSSFKGEIIHSAAYKNGKQFKDKHVLVVGFGNSACEIAICLTEHGAHADLSVRSGVNVVPRDLARIPILSLSNLMAKIPYKIADILTKPVIAFKVGNIATLGLKKAPYGPIEQIVKYKKVPLLDIGTMDLIKKGKIKVFGDITSIHNNTIHFENNKSKDYDAILLGTGYNNGLSNYIDLPEERFNDITQPIKDRTYFGMDNIYFCGYYVAPSGMIREMTIESGKIVERIID